MIFKNITHFINLSGDITIDISYTIVQPCLDPQKSTFLSSDVFAKSEVKNYKVSPNIELTAAILTDAIVTYRFFIFRS